MKILIEGGKERYNKLWPKDMDLSMFETYFFERGTSNAEKLAAAKDAEIVFADAISVVDRELIENMPNLKMIHSEGVAFNSFDVKAAAERGIFVCNNKACNAGAVAEQTVMLMLNVLRYGIIGDEMVRSGRQMAFKEERMFKGITELGDCKVGLIGFGAIAKETAKRLIPFGCKVYYNTPHRKDEKTEDEYGVTYMEREELIKECDIISLHTVVTEETKNMVNDDFISKMKDGAFIINTARGELTDNEALRRGIISGKLCGVGLDTIYPEPNTPDNPIIDLPEEYKYKAVFAPHLGGITTSSFRRAHKNMWENAVRIYNGERPVNIVNGI